MTSTKSIQHNGSLIPWVTRWSDEVINERVSISAVDVGGQVVPALHYPDGHEVREDETGVLWIREGVTRGGEPLLADVSAYRQRAAMTKGLCQVCGRSAWDESRGVIHWLAPRKLLIDKGGELVTMSPPTCQSCIPIALQMCPHLRSNDWVIGRVSEYAGWGVAGDAIRWKDPGKPELGAQTWRKLLWDYQRRFHPEVAPVSILAKQLLMRWVGYEIEQP